MTEDEEIQAAFAAWHLEQFQLFSDAMGLRVEDSDYFDEEHEATDEFIAGWKLARART
jgi:hypothetical protein